MIQPNLRAKTGTNHRSSLAPSTTYFPSQLLDFLLLKLIKGLIFTLYEKIDMFYVFAEPSFLWWFFPPTVIFKSATLPHPTKLILRTIFRVPTYIFFSKFARPLRGSEERALRHLTKKSFFSDRVTLLDLEKFWAPLQVSIGTWKKCELLYRTL